MFRSKSHKFIIFCRIIIGCLRGIIEAGRGDNIFIQYPYYPAIVNQIIIRFLQTGRLLKHYKTILLIHDVVSLRSEYITRRNLQKEIKLFNCIDKVVCHNDKMKQVLTNNGGRGNYSILGPFDYLYSKGPIDIDFQGKLHVIIAGNLIKKKCGYVYKLSEIKGCKFNLYGISYSGISNDSILYKGQYHPNKLIENLDGSFGLVWDGDSIETCIGKFGEYLKYNCPHKFSLYLAAGIPLIVWKESAIAFYVEKYGLGLCVDSLYQLSSLNIAKGDYMKMRANVLEYRKGIITGEHLKNALNEN
ncbi:MAG: hypothetical protein LUC91_08805 [Prevotella sp.]|nr:hypothetical protein [Prevotella sp.]